MGRKFLFTLAATLAFWVYDNTLCAQNFEWAKQVGGNLSYCQPNYSILDHHGNVYTTGLFKGTVDFDPGPNTKNFTSVGIYDIFILKLDPSGNLIWAKQVSGTNLSNPYAISVDAIGNPYYAGYFYGTIDFDPGTGPGDTSNLTSVGSSDIFVSKLDTSGNFIWAKQMGGSLIDVGQTLSTDKVGNVIVSGYFDDKVDFNPGKNPADTFYMTSLKSNDIFIVKLDSSGQFIWSKQLPSKGMESTNSIVVDLNGYIYSTGIFSDTIDMNPGNSPADTFMLNTDGNYDIYILKLDPLGNFKWAKQLGGKGYEESTKLIIENNGNIYTTGYFNGSVDFDPGINSTDTFNLTSKGVYDIFISKLDTSGNFIWAKKMGGLQNDVGSSISLDKNGNIYTTGYFIGIADFDPGANTQDTFSLTSSGNTDGFISKLDASGNFIWARKFGGTGLDFGQTIAIDKKLNIYTIGLFNKTIDFDLDSSIADTFYLTALGSPDGFIHKMNQCNITPYTDVQLACDSFVWIDGITYKTSNNTATYTYINANGCDSLIYLNLTIIPVSKATISASGATSFCKGNSVILTGPTGNNKDVLFNGANIVNCGNSDSLKLYSGTIEAWIKTPNAGSSFRGIVVKENAFGLFLLDNKIYIHNWTGGTSYTGQNIADTNWHHIAFVFQDGVTNGSQVYIDGIASGAAFTYNVSNQNNPLTIGSNNLANQQEFKGEIDEIRIWKTLRTPAEISSKSKVTIPSNSTGLVAYYRIDEGTGSSLNDLTRNGINGTFINSPTWQTSTSPLKYYTYLWKPGNDTTQSIIANTSGNYTVQITDANGCGNTSAAQEVTVYNPIDTFKVVACGQYTWTAKNNKVYTTNNTTDTIMLTSFAGCDSIVTLDLTINKVTDITTSVFAYEIKANNVKATYQWLDCNKGFAPIAGQTAQTFRPTGNGNYAVQLKENNCIDTSACVTMIIEGLDINDLSQGMYVYPNPTVGMLNLSFENQLQWARVIVTNSIGQEVGNFKFQNPKNIELNLPHPAGIYYIEIISESKKAVFKVVKE